MANGYIPAEVERGCDPCRPTRVEQKAFLGGVLGIDVNGERQPISEAGIVDLTFIEEETREAAEQAIASAQAAAESEQTASEAAASARSSESAAQTAANAAEAAKADAEDAARSANSSKNTADSYATAAQSAAAIAQTAQGYAERSAESAIAAAAQAASSSGSALSSANDAYTSASAAQAASEAAQTAQTAAEASEATASTAATTATQAATDAQAAQSSAEAAQSAAANSATAASGSATAAAGSAAQAAASATAADASAAAAAQSAAAAQAAAQNVIDKAPIITDTASGAIASFPDGTDAPIKQLTVNIEPQQDLHGYDNPWPAGGGKNLLPTDSVFHDASTGDVMLFSGSISGTYTFSVDASGVTSAVNPGAAIGRIMVDGTYQNISINNPKKTVTGEITAVYVPAAQIYAQYRGTAKFQLESGTTATAWTPYSNICPITGWTGANVEAHGANILGGDALKANVVSNVSSATVDTPNKTVSFGYNALPSGGDPVINGIPFKPNTRYTFILAILNPSIARTNLRIDYTDGSFTAIGMTKTNEKEIVVITSDANKTVKAVGINRQGGTTTIYYDESGIFEGVLTATGFAPYTGTSYPITWQSEAGTVYGGTITVDQDGTGTLRAEWAKRTVTSSDTIASSTNAVYFSEDRLLKSTDYRNLIKCDKLLTVLRNSGTMATYSITGYNDANNSYPNSNWIYFRCAETMSVNVAKAWLDEVGGIDVVFKLATPITYTLTAPQMRTLLGANNWWADTGNVSVDYRADTKLYIDKKLAALLAALS